MRVEECQKRVIPQRVGWWLCMLLVFPVCVQAERLAIMRYTTTDGLARDHVRRIIRDSRGLLWFCTTEGLSRFDGYTFANYGTDEGLPHHFVSDLLETRDGRYWIATGGGLCLFNPRAHHMVPPGTRQGDRSALRFTVYHPAEDRESQFVNVLLEDHRGTIWCGTNGGLYRLDRVDQQWAFRFVDIGVPTGSSQQSVVNALLEDRKGALWVGTESGLYRRRPDGRTERYTTRSGLQSNALKALLKDRRGRLWAGTFRGLCQLVPDPAKNRPIVAQAYTARDGLPDNWVTSLFQSSDGCLWVGTTEGLCEFIPGASPTGPPFRSYTTSQGLGDVHINTLAEDLAGNLWIGTESGGAMRLARNGFTTYTTVDGLGQNQIGSIFEDRAGDLCVVSGSMFINRFDGRRFTAIQPNVPNHMIWGWSQVAFQDHTGDWWVPTAKGLYRFPNVIRVERLAHTQPRAVYTTSDGLTGDDVFRVFEDSAGDIWIGTIDHPQVLTRWERETGQFYRYSDADGLPRAAPTTFCQDRRGNLWIGFYSGGLARYRDGRFRFFSPADGVPAGMIRGLYLDRAGRLWIATSQGGASRVDDPTADQPQFVSYTTAEGLASNYVSCFTEDQWRRLYIGTGRGVDRLDPVTGQIKHYTTSDGLASSEVNVAFRDRQGGLWFGTLRGISRLTPRPVQSASPPPILIIGLRTDGISVPISELGETDIANLNLGPRRNRIRIDFAGLSMAVGEGLRYQYKLEGAEEHWSRLTDQRSVNYARLSPGTYRFLVRAVSSDGLTSAVPAAVRMTVFPPIWRRWWVLTLVAGLLGMVAFAVHRYRVGRLVELERVRTRIATDLHDEIGAGLSQMALLSEVVKRQMGISPHTSEQMLTEIAETGRELVEAMSDIVWSIDPRRDDLRSLVFRVRQFASHVLDAKGIRWKFRAPNEPEKVKLSPEQRRHVYLIFKEAVNNIVRHADAGSVWLSMSVTGRQLVAEIRDDGCGFETPISFESISRDPPGHGLENMRARAAALGGQLRIDSAPGHGICLTLTVPLT